MKSHSVPPNIVKASKEARHIQPHYVVSCYIAILPKFESPEQNIKEKMN